MRAFFAMIAWALMSTHGLAQQLDPDEVAIFDGESRLNYQGDQAFELSAPATVEFWVSAGWLETLDYDPCVLSSVGEAGINFAAHITGDRSAIGLYAGQRFASLPFDFTDEAIHHVAFFSLSSNLTEVQIDGVRRGLLAVGFQRSPSVSFHLGSLDGEQSPFVGALARVRLWTELAGPDTDPSALAAQSLFSSSSLSLAVYPRISGATTDAEATEELRP
jgi:hypothetical protein